jgi:hypothetical protein
MESGPIRIRWMSGKHLMQEWGRGFIQNHIALTPSPAQRQRQGNKIT